MAEFNITQIDRQIRKNAEDAADLRRQAQTERDRARQTEQADFHDNEARRLEERAEALEAENPQLESQRADAEQRANDLQQQREQINRELTDKLATIDKEIERIRGSTLAF